MTFGQQYSALREKERRLYNDEQVMQLPMISVGHPHYKEWQMRRYSSEKLVKYLRNKKRALNILEIGCGNGWLCNKLASIPGSKVTGFDVNVPELQQASRVFDAQANLQFASEDPFLLTHLKKSFDVIVFAASIQYFPSAEKTMNDALELLADHGSIHIIDSHFYQPDEIAAAKLRSELHYQSLGLPGMSRHYFHHTIQSLKKFNAVILYNPASIWRKLQRNKSPFPWICIKKQ